MLRRGWCAVTFFTSEQPKLHDVERRTLAHVYRSLHQLGYGPPKSLGDWLRQEGLARHFAGMTVSDPPRLPEKTLLESTSFGTIYAVLYGDERAKEAGYAPLGWKSGEGIQAALKLVEEEDPVEILRAAASKIIRSGPSLRS
jgi:hypothetical protein